MEAAVTVSSSCCCLAVHSTKGAAISRGFIPTGSGRRCLYIERKRFVFRCKLSKQRPAEEGFAARPKNPDNKKVPLMLRVEQTVKKLLRKKAVVVSLWLATGTMFVVTVCYLACRWKSTSMPAPALVPYSHLVTTLETGAVSAALFEEGSKRIFYRLNSHEPQPQRPIGEQHWHFLTRRIDNDEGYLLGLMRGHGVTYSSAPVPLSSSLSKLAFTLASLWIPLMPLMWLVHKQISGNSSSQRRASTQQSVTFEDVEGVDAAKAELMEIVQCLQGAINYRKLGASLPKGVLLVGQPGTGKTLLARAVAGEAGVPFYTASASEFVELFVGRGASRIRDLFKVARKCAPSIIFIDEIDAVGGRRGRSFNDERDQTLNQLLTEMDGFESNNGVLVIAATNRADALDPALCRPGRFNRRVIVKEPDLDGRKRILSVHLRGILLEDDPELVSNSIASATSGFVGADLANVVNEAALLAARHGKDAVTLEYFKEAVHRAKYGIGDKVISPTNIGKEVGKLLSWIPSRVSMNVSNDNQPMGYQTLT